MAGKEMKEADCPRSQNLFELRITRGRKDEGLNGNEEFAVTEEEVLLEIF